MIARVSSRSDSFAEAAEIFFSQTVPRYTKCVRGVIGRVQQLNDAADELAGGAASTEPTILDMVGAFGRSHSGGTPIFVRPEEVAFSVDFEHPTAPLAVEIGAFDEVWLTSREERSDELEVPGVHLNLEPWHGLVELAGGRLKLRSALSDFSGCPIVRSIENNEQKVRFEKKIVPGLIVHRNFYAREWASETLRADWVGGGPPCIWSSKAGAQREGGDHSTMFTQGTAEVADHYAADFADWEQPHEAALLRDGKAIDEMDAAHALCKKPMRRTPLIGGNAKRVEVLTMHAKAGGGCARIRLLAHFEGLHVIELLGEAPPLDFFAVPPIRIRDVLVSVSVLDPLMFVQGGISMLSSTVSVPGRLVLESAATRTVFLCPEEEGTVRGAPDMGPFLVTSPISPLCHITRFGRPRGVFRM